MPENIITHPVNNNEIIREGKEVAVFGVSKIIVGIENQERREILQDEASGLNYSRTAVEALEIYSIKTQKHRPWFLLDLETGSRGWYPGCEIHGEVLVADGEEVLIKNAPRDDSEIVGRISKASSVVIKNLDAIDQEPYDEGWYKILYDVEGYIKKEFITNLRYADPNKI